MTGEVGKTLRFIEEVRVNKNGTMVTTGKRVAILNKIQMKNKALIKMFKDAGWEVVADQEVTAG